LCAQPSRWDILKASCLAIGHKNRSQKNLFNLAGDILCYIKAHKVSDPGRPHFVVPDIWTRMRFKNEKKVNDKAQIFAQPGAVDQDEEDYGSLSNVEYESLFDEFYSAQESMMVED
jgi:hypothetical protein